MTKEEAIKVAYGIPVTKAQHEALQFLIPELRESEDEMIIEEIKFAVIQMPSERQDTKDRCLAWLEKQKEQKEELVHRLNGLMQDYIKEGKDDEEKEHRLKCYQLFWDALEDTNFFEQKEQKPTDKIDLKFNIGDTIINKKNGEKCTISNRCLLHQYYSDTNHCHEIKFDEQDDWELVKEQKQTDLPAGFYYIDLNGNRYYSKEFRYGDMKLKAGEQKPVLTAKEAWKEMRLEVYAQASGNRHEPNYSDDSTKMFSLCDIDEIFEKIGNSTVEQKSAEKQDYSGLNDPERAILRGFLAAGIRNVSVGIIKETAKDCIAHFPWPTKWSKEDENTINELCNIIASNSKNGYLGRHYTGDLIQKLKSLRPQPREEIYQSAKHDLAIKFMNYLDENRPEGKMSLSNGECEDIDKAFKENDWAKIMRYVEKYSPQLKQDWSEKEEKIISEACCSINEYARSIKKLHFTKSLELFRLCEKLKSLRPPFKPSEEQMDALKELIDDANRAGWVTPGATELYEQLKKL